MKLLANAIGNCHKVFDILKIRLREFHYDQFVCGTVIKFSPS
jgi:hypothetical protein